MLIVEGSVANYVCACIYFSNIFKFMFSVAKVYTSHRGDRLYRDSSAVVFTLSTFFFSNSDCLYQLVLVHTFCFVLMGMYYIYVRRRVVWFKEKESTVICKQIFNTYDLSI